MTWLYIGLAGAAACGVLAVAAWAQRGARRPDDGGTEPLPLTTLQKRSWVALVLGLVAMVGLVALFAIGGLELYDRAPGMRLAVYALLAAGVAIHSMVLPRTLRGEPRPWADERDLLIFERAPAIQGAAVLAVLAGWAIGLTETYDSAGAIPIVFPSLIFLSAFFVHMTSISFALLLGYRRAVVDA